MSTFSVRAGRILTGFVACVVITSGCVPDPQRSLALALFQEMASARARLTQGGDLAQTCDQAGVVRGKLATEVRMNLPPEPWNALRGANDAFFAACGYLMLLSLPGDLPAATRDQWRVGADLQLANMCESLVGAATTLGQPRPAACG